MPESPNREPIDESFPMALISTAQELPSPQATPATTYPLADHEPQVARSET